MIERSKFLRSLEPKGRGRISYELILSTAASIFAEIPMRVVTVRDLLEATGCGAQTIYNYFPGGLADIAVTLYDRSHRSAFHGFNSNLQVGMSTLVETGPPDPRVITSAVAKCLAESVFFPLRECPGLHKALTLFMVTNRLPIYDTHLDRITVEVGRAINVLTHFRFNPLLLERGAFVATHAVFGIARGTVAKDAIRIADAETEARRVARWILTKHLQPLLMETNEWSGDVMAYINPALHVEPASINRTLLARILARKSPKGG